MKFDFNDIDAAQQTLVGLNKDEQDQFWSFVQNRLAVEKPGAVPFKGGVVLTAECDCGPDTTIIPLTPVPDEFREIIQSLPEEGGFAPRGTVKEDCLFLYCGPELGRGRLYMTKIEVAEEFLRDLFPGSRLTVAEMALVFDLLVGHELRSAATRDGTSYETKRTLLKRALNKTQCASQSQLISRTLSSFLIQTHDAHQSSSASKPKIQFRHWATSHLPECVRSHTLIDDHDQTHHMLDFGPATGRPVIAFMPTVFPFIFEDYVKEAERSALRIVMPLRQGALETSLEAMTHDELLASALRGADLARSFLGTDTFSVVGFSNGCNFAVAAAQRFKEKVNCLTLVSPLFPPPGSKRPLDSFRNGFIKMAHKAPKLRRLALRYLAKRTDTPEKFKSFVVSLANKESPDRVVIANEFSDPKVLKYYHQFAQNSFSLFLADNLPGLTFEPQDLSELESPISVIRGDQDNTTSNTAIDTLRSALPNACWQEISGAGHVMRFEHFQKCIRLIGLQID